MNINIEYCLGKDWCWEPSFDHVPPFNSIKWTCFCVPPPLSVDVEKHREEERKEKITMLLVDRFRTSSLIGLAMVVALSAAMNFSVSHAHYELSTTLGSEDTFVMGRVHEATTILQNKEGGTAIDKARMSYSMKGRKMMMEMKEREKDIVVTKKDEVKKEMEYASNISGANYSVGKCEHKKEGEISTIGRRLSRRSNKSKLLPFKTNHVGGRHISLNADYHVPRPHPPKNN